MFWPFDNVILVLLLITKVSVVLILFLLLYFIMAGRRHNSKHLPDLKIDDFKKTFSLSKGYNFSGNLLMSGENYPSPSMLHGCAGNFSIFFFFFFF